MKNLLNVLCLLTVIIALASCDKEAECEADFTGTYTGTETCTLLITTSTGDLTEVIITGEDGDYVVNGEEATQDGCTLTVDKTILGLGTVETITLSGDTLTLSSDKIDGDCVFTGVR